MDRYPVGPCTFDQCKQEPLPEDFFIFNNQSVVNCAIDKSKRENVPVTLPADNGNICLKILYIFRRSRKPYWSIKNVLKGFQTFLDGFRPFLRGFRPFLEG